MSEKVSKILNQIKKELEGIIFIMIILPPTTRNVENYRRGFCTDTSRLRLISLEKV